MDGVSGCWGGGEVEAMTSPGLRSQKVGRMVEEVSGVVGPGPAWTSTRTFA